MKANELRIGNLVYEHGGNVAELRGTHVIGTITVIFNKFPARIEQQSVKLIKPIPLTDEWLKKLGFKPFQKDWSIKGLIVHSRKRGFIVRKSIPQLEYVHQLQNLYFALTGEELSIA